MFDEENKTKTSKKVKSHKKSNFGHFIKSQMENVNGTAQRKFIIIKIYILNQYFMFTQR